MKKLLGLLLYLPLAASYAEYPLADNSEIVGVWTVDAESPKLDGPKTSLEQRWEFKTDGVIVSTSTDPRASSSFPVNLKYWVEDGKIKKEIRPGKTEMCTVVEKEGPKMTLYCRNLYFFLTKK